MLGRGRRTSRGRPITLAEESRRHYNNNNILLLGNATQMTTDNSRDRFGTQGERIEDAPTDVSQET